MAGPIAPAPTTPATFVGQVWPAADRGRDAALRLVVLALAGSAVLAISAKVQVPFWPVPMTLQSLAVLVIGAAYGWRLGVATVALYLTEGALGLPVFAGTPPAAAGPLYFAGPTGGFLFGFLAVAALCGFLAERGWNASLPRILASMTLGHAILFAIGLAWLSVLVGPAKAWALGAQPFLLATLVKTALAASLVQAGWTLIKR